MGGFVKCGSTVRSSQCGWQGGSWGGSPWTIHPGWRRSSFCESHYVGYFCFSHRKVHYSAGVFLAVLMESDFGIRCLAGLVRVTKTALLKTWQRHVQEFLSCS